MPIISVIIPTYNRANVLPRAVDSVLAQTDAEFELIVVDDGSTEKLDGGERVGSGSFSALQEKVPDPFSPKGTGTIFKNQKWSQSPSVRILRQENKGPAAARNLGIKHAEGEWIAFLDSDDEWLPGKLKAQLKFFRENPDYLICQTEEIWVRNGKRVNPMKKHKKYGGRIFEKCLPLCVVSPSAVMMHRKLFDEVGLFDESLPACEDYDLWLRIAARHPIGLIEKPYIIKYGGHADQRSREFPAMDRFRIRSLAKILREGSLNPEQEAAARLMMEEKVRIFIQGALKRGNEKEAEEIEKLVARASGSAPRQI